MYLLLCEVLIIPSIEQGQKSRTNTKLVFASRIVNDSLNFNNTFKALYCKAFLLGDVRRYDLGIDLGLDNFATVVSNDGSEPVLINGTVLDGLKAVLEGNALSYLGSYFEPLPQ